MKTTKRANAEYRTISHKGFKLFFTLMDYGKGVKKEALSISTNELTFTKFSSKQLTENTARILGEMLIELSNQLK